MDGEFYLLRAAEVIINQRRFEMVEPAGSLQAVALLIDELNSEDNKVRLNSVRNI